MGMVVMVSTPSFPVACYSCLECVLSEMVSLITGTSLSSHTGKHRKRAGGRGNAGGMHHHRINFDK